MAVEIPKAVLRKLIFFTAAMVIMPLFTFFTCQWLFNNNALVSGGMAAFMANVVLIGYIVAAFTEEIPAETTTKEHDVKLD